MAQARVDNEKRALELEKLRAQIKKLNTAPAPRAAPRAAKPDAATLASVLNSPELSPQQADVIRQQQNNTIQTNLESSPQQAALQRVEAAALNTPDKISALVDAFQAFSGNRFASQQQDLAARDRQRRVNRAAAASQLMRQLSGLPEEQRQQFLPEDLRFVKPRTNIPQELYQSIGKPGFEAAISGFIQSNPSAKREDILSLMSAHRAEQEAAARANARTSAADRRASNPYQKRFDNAVSFLEESGVKLSPEARRNLARSLALGKQAELLQGTADQPVSHEPVDEAPTAPAPTSDPRKSLSEKYGVKF